MFLLFDINEVIIIEIFGGCEILQNIYPVSDEALGIEIIGKIDIFTFILHIFKEFIVIKSGIVGAVKILFAYPQGIFSLSDKDIKGQTGMPQRSIRTQDIL